MPKLSILHIDDALLVVNKPAGLLTIPDGYDPSLPHLSGLLTTEYGRVWTVHRLDKSTSGAIVFARSAEAHRILNAQFEARETGKEYHALVIGLPGWDEQDVNMPLRANGDRRHRTVVDSARGKSAATSFTVQARYPAAGVSLLSARPHTGYTHQIRAHLAAIGFPIVGDELYSSQIAAARTLQDRVVMPPPGSPPPAGSPPLLPIDRTALHAFRLTFTHPQTGDTNTFEAPYPQDFAGAISTLTNPPPPAP